MKIGIDCRFYSSKFTGIGRYTFELVRNLLQIDKKNQYVLFFNKEKFQQFKTPNVKSVLVNTEHYSLKEQLILPKFLYQEKLDIMHFTHFNAPIFYRKPCVVTIHDLTPSFFPGKKFNQWHYKFAYNLVLKSIIKRSKQIISVSENTKKDILKFFPFAKNKIEMIYESVAEEFLKNPGENSLKKTKEKFNLKQDFLLYTGVFRNHKNLVGLIAAFGKLKKIKNFNGKLLITGKEDPFYPEVKNTIKNLNLEKDVILTGLIAEEDLINLYHLAKLYVFPSFYEGFGLPILEAFATKTPLICSNSSCLPEIAGDGNAKFFDPYNIDDLADKILQVWDDENLQKKLIKNGQERLKDFSWRKMAKETLALYQKVVSL